MHPILKNIRSTVEHSSPAPSGPSQRTEADMVSCGIASSGDDSDILRHKQREDRIPPSSVPVVDVFRDNSKRYMQDERHLQYHAGHAMDLDKNRILDVDDFIPDFAGTNEGQRRLQASEIYRNSKHTQDLEQWAFDTFVDHVRQLILRPETALGLLYLNDFLDTFVDKQPSHALIMQMITLQNHTHDPTLRRSLGKITDKTPKGSYVYQWLLDLISVLDMIFRDEHSVRERITAILTAINHISLHFAKKASGGHYPSSDKLAKTHAYFKRIVLAILSLSDSIGCYGGTVTPVRAPKRCHSQLENSDETYMFSLKGALESPDSDEETDTVTKWSDQNKMPQDPSLLRHY